LRERLADQSVVLSICGARLLRGGLRFGQADRRHTREREHEHSQIPAERGQARSVYTRSAAYRCRVSAGACCQWLLTPSEKLILSEASSDAGTPSRHATLTV